MASTIKVDNVQNTPGTNTISKCGSAITVGVGSDTVTTAGSGALTVSGNAVKSNAYQASDAGNIISQSGTTITVGASGDTVTLASGASQTGFGREGTVNWDTSIKTTGFTAVSGNGYFCNTTSGSFTLTLPSSPSAGDIVALKDYANTFDNNKLTIGRNSEKIEGTASNVSVTVEGQAITVVYIDSTQGWKIIDQGKKADVGFPEYITATGGDCVVTCGDYKVHVFKAPGTFCVSAVGNACGSVSVTALVVAGGGGGSQFYGGGGGAGGLVWDSDGYTVSATGYPISIGGGGAGSTSDPTPGSGGSNSTGLGFTANGGGVGAGGGGSAGNGGSGGGQGGNNPGGASGNQPGVSNPGATNYGNPGGPYVPTGGSGGGGAGGAGSTGGSGAGGVGLDVSPGFGTEANIGVGDDNPSYSSEMWFAGGGGGQGAAGGKGGGASRPHASPSSAAQVNTGGGGRGDAGGFNGGSGVVLIKYKFQN